jgi:hypothetical protein
LWLNLHDFPLWLSAFVAEQRIGRQLRAASTEIGHRHYQCDAGPKDKQLARGIEAIQCPWSGRRNRLPVARMYTIFRGPKA